MASKMSGTIDAVEAAILKVYARSNRDGPITCTLAAGWTATTGNVSAITLTMGTDTDVQEFNANELIGRHLLRAGIARRISANGETSSGVTAITCNDPDPFDTAPAAGSGEIRDGFVKTPDDVLLLDDMQDRRFQVVVYPPQRISGIVNKGTGRYRSAFEVQVFYEYGFDRRLDLLRANEDAQSITNALLDDANRPSNGVDLFDDDGSAEFIDVESETEAGGSAPGLVLVVRFFAFYTEGSLES